MSSMEEKLGGGRDTTIGQSARCFLKKHLSHYHGRVVEEEEYVRVFNLIDGKVEIWKKIKREKGDWLIEFTGTRYPISEEGKDNA